MKKILNICLCILLSFSIIGTTLYVSLSNSITEKQIKESIKKNLLTGFIYDESGNKTEIFNTILRLTPLTGNDSYKYTPERIIRIVENNMDKVLREIDYPITEKEREETLDYVRTHTDYIIDTIYKTDIGDYRKW